MELSPSKKCFKYFTESYLKMMKIAFYFLLKALFLFQIFTFLSGFFDCVEKLLEKNANFKIFDVTDWTTIF